MFFFKARNNWRRIIEPTTEGPWCSPVSQQHLGKEAHGEWKVKLIWSTLVPLLSLHRSHTKSLVPVHHYQRRTAYLNQLVMGFYGLSGFVWKTILVLESHFFCPLETNTNLNKEPVTGERQKQQIKGTADVNQQESIDFSGATPV